MQKLIEYWQARDARERVILGVGGSLVAVLLLYLLVWEPIQTDRQRLLRDLPKMRVQVEQFRRDAEEAEALRARARSRTATQSLPATVEASARQAQLGSGIKSVQAMGTDRAQVSGATVSFDNLVRWMATVAQSEGITVDALQASAGEPGRVQIESLILKR